MDYDSLAQEVSEKKISKGLETVLLIVLACFLNFANILQLLILFVSIIQEELNASARVSVATSGNLNFLLCSVFLSNPVVLNLYLQNLTVSRQFNLALSLTKHSV